MSDSDELKRIRREFERQEAIKRAQEHGISYADLAKFKPEPDALAMVPRDFALKFNVIPLKNQEKTLFVAMADPGDIQASDALRLLCRCTIRPVMASREDIHENILKYYPSDVDETDGTAQGRSELGAMRPAATEIKFFYEWEEYGCFSNYARVGFELDGAWWPSSEHYYHLQKFKYTPDTPEQSDALHDLRKAICQAATPGDAQILARNNKTLIRRDWEQVKDDVMRRAVLRKFECNPALAAFLLDTGNATLIENSPYDAHFGVGRDGSGLNMLGKILMETRATLRESI